MKIPRQIFDSIFEFFHHFQQIVIIYLSLKNGNQVQCVHHENEFSRIIQDVNHTDPIYPHTLKKNN